MSFTEYFIPVHLLIYIFCIELEKRLVTRTSSGLHARPPPSYFIAFKAMGSSKNIPQEKCRKYVTP